MIRRLAHLCLVTEKLAEMRGFYEGVLGLPVKFEFHTGAGEAFGYYFDCGDSSFIEIFDNALKTKQWGGPVTPLQAGNRYTHFCLEVTGLRELKGTLEAKGLKLSEVRGGMDGSLQSWTNDPDGNAIELMEYTAKSLQIRRSDGPLVAR